ncbi:MAG: RNA polymerase sigma factor [candidate division Zixibacteria bacterium]|nr:RNA polymerase sigma factor [candidate division Zixibacteria bacterium]
MSDDRKLVSEISAGNKAAFKDFIEQYQKLVCHVVFRMVSNDTDREDLCQDVFIKVYQNIGNFRFESKVSTWVAQIAYNSCVSFLRKNKTLLYDDLNPGITTLDDLSGNNVLPDEYSEVQDLSRILVEEIDKLPLIYGTILSLYHLEQMSYNEICEIMQLPEGTVKSYLFRARRLLKNKLLAKYQQEDI